jgi:hypothetical protein
MKVVSKWHCSATEEPAATLPRHDRRVGAILRTIGKQAKNRETPMNKTVLSIIVCSMFALPAGAATISGGKITSVDAGGTSFSYSKKKKHWKFRITDKTVIRVGDKTGNLSDLKTGQSVKVEYQRQGSALAALIIIGIGF